MSAIVGLYRRDGAPVGDALDAMVAAIAHRGPDGVDTWRAGPVGLGHLRLQTSDRTPDGVARTVETALTAAGRIDNRAALQDTLDVPADATDDTLLAAAHDAWGSEFPTHLLGVFATAVWDDARDRLVCARDHVGVKPLYYHLSPDLFAVASEPTAILALPSVDDTPDEHRIAQHLAATHLDYERTFHRAIRRLPPAHTLAVGPDRLTTRRYWTPDVRRVLDLGSDAAYERAFREHFRQAVACRLPDGPAGTFLSGGLDSSAVACVARDCHDTPVHTYSFAFPTVPESDERSFIEAVLAQPGFAPAMVRADRIDPLVDADDRAHHLAAPLPTGNTHLFWTGYRSAATQDVRVVLNGFEGDAVVSHGLEFLPTLALRGRWIQLARAVHGVSRSLDDSLTETLRNRVLTPLVPTPLRRAYVAHRGGVVYRASPVIDEAFATRVGLAAALRHRERSVRGTTPRERHRDVALGPEIVAVFETMDALAGAHGVVPRYPFFDRRLIAFCLALPVDQRVRDGYTRSIVRRALAETLPARVARRPGKTYIGRNFALAFHAHGADRIEGALCDGRPAIAPYVDGPALRAACRHYLAEPTAGPLVPVWVAFTLESWIGSIQHS